MLITATKRRSNMTLQPSGNMLISRFDDVIQGYTYPDSLVVHMDSSDVSTTFDPVSNLVTDISKT